MPIGLAGAALFYGARHDNWVGPAREPRFAFDSSLEEAGFEPSVPRAAGAIETRALRRMLSDSEVDSKVKGRTI